MSAEQPEAPGTRADRAARPDPTPQELRDLARLINGYRVSQAIYVAAVLGIPDRLADGPRASDDLALEVSAHPGALHRLLRYLAGVGLVAAVGPRRFALTPLGAGLCADTPGSARPVALMALADFMWRPWGQLLHSVRTGETAFEHVHGMDSFAYMRAHPDDGAAFNAAMTSNTARSEDALVRAYDFSGSARVVDVGGGQGLLLASVLRAYPALRGVLFDLPEVTAGAHAVLGRAGVAERCEVVGGDFFTDALPTGDVYLLRQVIHDWDDTRAVAILANCRRAIHGPGRVLVIERSIAADYRAALPELNIDLAMLVVTGGLQRTAAEYEALFTAAGLRFSRAIPLGDPLRNTAYEGAAD